MDSYIEQRANETRFLNEVHINMLFSTMCHFRLPWLNNPPITDLVTITNKYRKAGVIR